jgi:hypothetical protein
VGVNVSVFTVVADFAENFSTPTPTLPHKGGGSFFTASEDPKAACFQYLIKNQ